MGWSDGRRRTRVSALSSAGHCMWISMYCTVMYCSLQYCMLVYCTVPYCTVLYHAVLYRTVLYCSVLYCTLLYMTVCGLIWEILSQSSFVPPRHLMIYLSGFNICNGI